MKMKKVKSKVNVEFDYQCHHFEQRLNIQIYILLFAAAYHYGRDFHLSAIYPGFFELAINVCAMYDALSKPLYDPLNFKIVKAIPKFIVRFEIQNGISVEKLIFET